MFKFNSVQKNEIKQKIVEHMGSPANACTVATASVSATSTCIPSTGGGWVATSLTHLATGAKCVNGSTPGYKAATNHSGAEYRCT
jgi:hypothetical protein